MWQVGNLALANSRVCLSHISYAYLTSVAMWDKYFRQQANIGITQSCMRWYVRKGLSSYRRQATGPVLYMLLFARI